MSPKKTDSFESWKKAYYSACLDGHKRAISAKMTRGGARPPLGMCIETCRIDYQKKVGAPPETHLLFMPLPWSQGLLAPCGH